MVMSPHPRSSRLSLEQRVLTMSIMAGLPGSLVAFVLLWTGDYTAKVQWTFTVVIVVFWLGFAFSVRERVVFPLRTFSNLLAALREGDYSVRARGAKGEDALSEVMQQVNAMGETLREQRLGALEATTLLRKVMAEINVAVFAFDVDQRLRLVNRAGERLLAQPVERLLNSSAGELGLAEYLEGKEIRTMDVSFPGGAGRWELSRSTFRERGLPHQLLVISDLTRTLREEELQAWQRLVRVLGHELNNSLAPIKSIAGSLATMLNRQPRPRDWEEDLRCGLGIIESRSEALSRFLGAYTQLARLPQPRQQTMEIAPLVRRLAGLETRVKVSVLPGPELTIRADPDQIEQLLINLLRNGTDASLETGGRVQIGWMGNGSHLEIWVEDEGPGIPSTANLFVPFFTTKPGGSGIGLVLSRQIAERRGGTLKLENRPGGAGCEARLRLPVQEG